MPGDELVRDIEIACILDDGDPLKDTSTPELSIYDNHTRIQSTRE